MDKIKWTVVFQRVNDDFTVATHEDWCYATDVEDVRARMKNEFHLPPGYSGTIVRITEANTGKVAYDYEEQLKKNCEKLRVMRKKYNK